MDNKSLSVEKKMKAKGSCHVRKTGKTRETSLPMLKSIQDAQKLQECICVILMAHSHNCISMETQTMTELKCKV